MTSTRSRSPCRCSPAHFPRWCAAVYAECPYAFLPGWDAADAERDEDHRWEDPLARIAAYFGTARRHTVRLDDETMALKLAMLDAHGSQSRALALEIPGLLDFDGPLRTEVHWTAEDR